MGEKFRVDILLVNRGLISSRERAKLAIEQHLVLSDGKSIQKPSELLDESAPLTLLHPPIQYVGRGGLKLEKALRDFKIDVTGKICVDIGASTGGFTDCLLQNGAALVYAVDVGQNQLDESLRKDRRVISMENSDIRKISLSVFPPDTSFICVDVSFISLALLFPILGHLTSDSCDIVCLVKPQFEAGRGQTNKNGVVTDKKIHKSVLNNVLLSASSHNFQPVGLSYSPITGQSGNVEYLLHLRKNTPPIIFDQDKIVRDAFENARSKDGDHN